MLYLCVLFYCCVILLYFTNVSRCHGAVCRTSAIPAPLPPMPLQDLGGKAGPFTTALLDRCLKTNFVNTAMWVKLRELFIANELQHTHYICYEQIASADLGAKRAGIERVAGVLGFGGITQAEAGMLINATSIDNAAVGGVNWQGVRSGGQIHFTDYDLSLSLVGWMNSTYYQLETMHPSLCTQHRHAAGLF
jgi:hypothetical protein